ncbi:anaphase-promoting complex subunit 5 [Geosmithia morbida]|uniref:Anaphase-promoting complex subunit 5 n=1 Tax=Geosmithia morbida TaxID=1094350 RepID=A0A9P4YMT2_9HYPO|nr:anaphase-promoting complex subunit 5 [Geosmithia morbida]KAF4119841.1 anaphase-promoting complex subunit 5 [Geosmithia morbida]
MARYLTPAKIGLLALIELYTEDAVPSDAIHPVLSFITSHLLDRDPSMAALTRTDRWGKVERTVGLIIDIKDFEKLLGSYPFLLGVPGRRLWDQFLVKLWDINSLDAMHTFIENLSNMLAKSKLELRREAGGRSPEPEPGIRLTKNSLFGAFIRRSKVELDRLRWNDTTDLWRDFVRYRQPTAQYLKRRKPGFSRLSFDNVLLVGEQEGWDAEGVSALASVAYGDMLSGDQTGTLPVSTDDIESLLEFQIDQIQRYGSRVPLEIRNQFHDLLHDSFVVPSLTHYLHYLDAWRAGDYSTAFDLLHRYFDYTMQSRDRLFYQYALINMASLQAEFGCYKEAVGAMLESVTTARENRDMTSLNFALNWLFHFDRAHPDLVRDLETNSLLGTGKESLAFLRVKAKETRMWPLWSAVLLSEAKMGLSNGDSIPTAMEYIVRSSQIVIDKNMKGLFGAQLSLSAALWSRLGLTHMSAMTSEVFLRCHTHEANFDDELKLTCRLALMLSSKGHYEAALGRLDSLDENSLRYWKASQYWYKCRGIVKLQRDLRHNNLDGAEQLLDQLLQSKHDDTEPDAAYHIDFLHLECLTRRGDLQTAFEKVATMLAKQQRDNKDIALRVRLLLWKVCLLDRAGRPQRGFSVAIKATSIAWRARLMPYLWQSTGALSNILVSLGEFDAACQLLVATIPRALECEAPDVVGQLYSYLADANMGLAGNMEPKSMKRTEYMTAALAAVNKAFDHYSSIEDINLQCEMMAKKAMIMKLSGDMVLASNYAAAYVSLRKTAESLSLGP